MSALGDLGVGSTDLEMWTNMGRVGIWLGPGWGLAEPGPQDWEDWSEPSRPVPDAGLGWDPRAPLGQGRPYKGSWLEGKDLGSWGIA